MSQQKKNVFWLLVFLAMVLLWWWWKPPSDNGVGKNAPSDLAAADPDDILVDLKDSNALSHVAAAEKELGIELVLVSDQSDDERLYRAHVAADERDAILAALAKRPEVEIAEPDAQISLSPGDGDAEVVEPAPTHEGFPNDPLYKKQWHMRQIGMPEAWKLADGNGVIVAVLDTGVAYEDYKQVPQLSRTSRASTFVKPYDFVDEQQARQRRPRPRLARRPARSRRSTNNGIGVAGVALQRQDHAAQGAVGAAARARSPASPTRFATPPTTARRSSTCSSAARSRRGAQEGRRVRARQGRHRRVRRGQRGPRQGRLSGRVPGRDRGRARRSTTRRSRSTRTTARTSTSPRRAATRASTRTATACRDGVLQNTIVIGDPTKDDYFAFMGTSMASPHVAGVAALVVGEGVTNPDMVEKILKDTARKPDKQQVHDATVRRGHHRCAGGGPQGARSKPAAGSSASACSSAGAVAARARGAASASSSAPATSPASWSARRACSSCRTRAVAVVGAGDRRADARPAVVGPRRCSARAATATRCSSARWCRSRARARLRRAELRAPARRPRGRRRRAPRVLRGGAA